MYIIEMYHKHTYTQRHKTKAIVVMMMIGLLHLGA